MTKKLINFFLFQVNWFLTAFAASWGNVWVGPIAVAATVGVTALMVRLSWRELAFFGIAAGMGFVADTLLIQLGLVHFEGLEWGGWASPPYMIALWVNFSLTFLLSLRWLRHYKLASAGLGLLGGPIAYWGGNQFNAINFGDSLPVSLGAVGAVYMIATPLLFLIFERLTLTEQSGSDSKT